MKERRNENEKMKIRMIFNKHEWLIIVRAIRAIRG